MKVLLAYGILGIITKLNQEDDECNNHNNAPYNLPDNNWINPKRYVRSMIGIA